MSDGREALTLAELTAELVTAPPRPNRSRRDRAQAQRRQARKRTSPPAPARTVCGYCTRPALPDRYVCQQHADRIAAIAQELKATPRKPQRKPKGEDA
jgi:hypothetical protein